MFYQDFDYEEALNVIKAALFDICEAQEREVGSTSEEKRQDQIEKYITMKDAAITLIESIYNLYPKNKSEKKVDNNKVISKDLDKVKVVEMNPLLEEQKEEDKNNQEEQRIQVSQKEKLESENPQEKEASMESEKFFLDDRNGTKPNFAYVPPSLFEIIKKNGTIVLTNHEIIMDKGNLFYKSDLEKPKGIIVRNDQFMKLTLSKHRQEGVLEEAKIFRIEEAKKSRDQRLKEEQEAWNNKVKALKIA